MKTCCNLPPSRSARVLTAMLVLTVFGTLAASVCEAQTPSYALSVSTSSNHSNAIALQGATLSGNVYVFTSSATNLQNYDPSGIAKVCYWLDNPSMSGTARHCESYMPYDFILSVDNTTTSLANPWNTTQVANGTHTITQAVTRSAGGSEVDTATFTINNSTASAALQSVSVNPSIVTGGQGSTGTVTLTKAAPSGGVSVGLSSSNAAAQVGASVMVPANATSATFNITTSPVSASTPATISGVYNSVTKTATLTVGVSVGATYSLSVSKQANRSGAIGLNGAALSGNAYVFTSLASQLTNFNPAGITKVSYWLDNTAMTGSPIHTETAVPYDFVSTNGNLGSPWDTTKVANGAHTITQLVTLSAGGSEVDNATFAVQNISAPTATFSASPTTIPLSKSSTLTWTTTNATSVSIDNGIGTLATSGSFNVNPAVNTTYTLTATGPGGSVTKGVTIIVGTSSVQHYEYVLPDQNLYVYDMDNNFQLVKHVSLPQVQGTRGVGAVIGTHMLYISYGTNGNKSVSVPGSLLKYDLLTDTVVWTKTYSFGIDSFAISEDGSTIYMPSGVNGGNAIWYIIDAATGNVTGNINTGWNGAHDTVVSLDGLYVFMGPHLSPELVEGSTSPSSVVRNIGPLKSGVGPFTINGEHNLAFTTATGFFGFQVSDTGTGAVRYTVPVSGFSVPPGSPIDTPDHGISLSPDEKEIYLIDTANAYAHVFDVSGVSGLPPTAPTQVADIPLTTTFTGNQSPCLYECTREGWMRHTRDGQYVLVGDSGNVISTSTRSVVGTLPQLYNTRVYVEIDWQNGLPISTTTREGRGYVTK